MFRSAAGKVMWVGRATVFLVGLAVILVMVIGLASAAFSATGGNVILGQSNSANAPTTLVGNIVDTAKSALVLRNPNGGSALQLQVSEGAAPLKVKATAGTATGLSADKLDGKDSSELPGTVVQTKTITGDTSDAEPFGTLVFVTQTVTVTTTSSTQRLVGVVSAPLTIVADPGHGANPLPFRYGLCYRQAGTTSALTIFYGGSDEAIGTATTTPTSWTAAQKTVPGLADTWEVGFCARNAANAFVTLSGDGNANGWVEVMNPAPQ